MGSSSCVISTCFKHEVGSFDSQGYPLHKYSLYSGFYCHPTSSRCSLKVLAMEQFREPRKFLNHVYKFKDMLWEVCPEPVKQFPWKKAEDIIIQRLFVVGEKTLKWPLFMLFVVSSLSDAIFSISRNKELIIPLGLLVGCLTADLLKDVLQEFFLTAKEGDFRRHLLGIGFFFVLIKAASVYFGLGGQVFLSHVGNGGFMQLLWLWNNLQEEHMNENRESSM